LKQNSTIYKLLALDLANNRGELDQRNGAKKRKFDSIPSKELISHFPDRDVSCKVSFLALDDISLT